MCSRSARVAESLKQCSCSPADVGQIEFNMGKPNEKGKNGLRLREITIVVTKIGMLEGTRSNSILSNLFQMFCL